MALNKTGHLLGTKTGEEPGVFPQYTQPELHSGVSNTGHNVHNNISTQEGGKFSVNFGHDGIAARRVPVPPGTSQNRESRFGLNRENGHVRYEDLTNILGLRRMDSESSEMSDFIPIKQPAQEMENGASANILSKIQKEDSGGGHALRKTVVREPIGDQPGTGPAVSPLHRYENSQSNGYFGSGLLDDSLSGKMKFLCSFGGKILPRPSDGRLRYVGGETHIISIRKDISWEELVKKTLGICSHPHTIKYQLPGEDLDALISVSSDEDLQNMIEEYHGLESHEGSQKLRIFLVPLGESEETSSTEGSAVKQNDPDYQYVVALNGMVDASPKKNIGEQSLTNEASQSGASLNFSPAFQKPSPNASSPLDIRDGTSALNPDGILNDSLSLRRPLTVSPTPIQVAGPCTGYVQLLGNNSCQGSMDSNTSFVTAQLHSEKSGISTADCRYPQQVAVTLLSDRHPYQHGDVGQPKKLNGQHFDNYNPGKEFLTPVYVNPSDGYSDEVFGGTSHKDRIFQPGNPISRLDDPIFQQTESYGITDSSHGMPHAFSDSQLHESGARSAYCSQEGISQSFSLNLEKAQLSSILGSSVSQVNLMDSILGHSGIQSKIPKVEPAEMHRRQDLASSPYSEASGMNDPIHKDSILTEKKHLIAQTDLNGSGFVAKDAQENSVKLERMMIIEEKNPIPKKDNKVYERQSPVIDMGHGTELHLLDSFPANNINAKTNMQKNWELPSEDTLPLSSGIMGFSLDNLGDQTPSDLLDMSQKTCDEKKCALGEGLNGEQGLIFSSRNFDLNAPVLKFESSSRDESSVRDHVFNLSFDPDSLKSAQIQPSQHQIAAGFHDNPTVSSGKFHPAVLHDDFMPNLNLPVDELDIPRKNVSFKEAPSFLDDLITSMDQMVDRFEHEHSASRQSKVEDMISGQPKNLERCNDANRVEPFVVVADVAGVIPSCNESSLVRNPHILDEVESDVSPSHTEAESIIPESEPEVGKTEIRLEFMIFSLRFLNLLFSFIGF